MTDLSGRGKVSQIIVERLVGISGILIRLSNRPHFLLDRSLWRGTILDVFTDDYDIPRRQRRTVLVLASLVGELDDFLVLDGHSLELSDVLVPTAGGTSPDLSAEVARALQDTTEVDGSLLHVVESGKEDAGHSFLSEWAEGHQLENSELRIESGDVESVIVKPGPEYSLVIIGATERGLQRFEENTGGLLKSHLLDGVEHLFEFEAMVAKNRVCEVVKVRFTGFAPVLLSVFACGSSLNDLVASAVDARHRLARFGETETFKTLFT